MNVIKYDTKTLTFANSVAIPVATYKVLFIFTINLTKKRGGSNGNRKIHTLYVREYKIMVVISSYSLPASRAYGVITVILLSLLYKLLLIIIYNQSARVSAYYIIKNRYYYYYYT